MRTLALMLIIVKLSACYPHYDFTQIVPSVTSSIQRHFFTNCVTILDVQGNAGNLLWEWLLFIFVLIHAVHITQRFSFFFPKSVLGHIFTKCRCYGNYKLLDSSHKKEFCNVTAGNRVPFKKLRNLYMVDRSVWHTINNVPTYLPTYIHTYTHIHAHTHCFTSGVIMQVI
jgi:hypothetical protein